MRGVAGATVPKKYIVRVAVFVILVQVARRRLCRALTQEVDKANMVIM